MKNKNRFAEDSDGEIKKTGGQFRAKKYEKIHKLCRNYLSAFALRN